METNERTAQSVNLFIFENWKSIKIKKKIILFDLLSVRTKKKIYRLHNQLVSSPTL